jgi:DNA repair protein RecN (Recombination protein N)
VLIELRIRNFAIIESVTLPLSAGLNVLSGETGAGKSIIVGALGLLLGERGNSDVIRTGADKASVEGVFEIGDRDDLLQLADNHGIETDGGSLVLKREISTSGRGRAWINGTPVTTGVLAEIGRALVNLHGQHEAQTLLDPESQRHILDAFGNAGHDADIVRDAYNTLTEIRRQIADIMSRRADAEKRADYLRHVVREIEDAKLIPGEDVKLEDEARVLENADELRTLSESAVELLSAEESGIIALLSALQRVVAQIQRIDTTATRFQDMLDNGFYALEELTRVLGEYGTSVELDPERLNTVRVRRDLLFRLIKKYGGTLDDVIATGQNARAELDLVDSAGLDIQQLQERETNAYEHLKRVAAKLTTIRTTAARKIAKAVDAILPELGMEGGRFLVVLVPRSDIGPTGAEDIEFRVALNVGYDPRPLSRVASGGELSRVMLAVKTILARVDRVPTLVFDEVDAGIGGKVGLQVGDTMRRVAQDHQVFAISHLPQIAARAHHHIVVAKGAKGGVTTADITVLTPAARVEEIARMLGGDPESKVSRAHAKELLEAAAAS